jgi:hypothetical protein
MGAIYASGSRDWLDAGHMLTLNLPRSSIDGGTATFLCRFIELWCNQQCTSGWRIQHQEYKIVVEFQTDRDCVLFSLTDEYEYMTSRQRTRGAFTQSNFR